IFRYISKDRGGRDWRMECWNNGVAECWNAGLGECTAETRSKEFLIKRFSELCELWASVVNTSSQETRGETGERSVGVMSRAVECSTPIIEHSSRPALLHESFFLGVAGELDAGINAELLIDVVKMHLDGSLADEEFLADLHITQPRRHLFDNFDFSE